jgi:hypothetical protein
MVDARDLALAVPIEYRYGPKPTKAPSYAKAYSAIEAITGVRELGPLRGPASYRY